MGEILVCARQFLRPCPEHRGVRRVWGDRGRGGAVPGVSVIVGCRSRKAGAFLWGLGTGSRGARAQEKPASRQSAEARAAGEGLSLSRARLAGQKPPCRPPARRPWRRDGGTGWRAWAPRPAGGFPAGDLEPGRRGGRGSLVRASVRPSPLLAPPERGLTSSGEKAPVVAAGQAATGH